MYDSHSTENNFLSKISDLIEANLSNEQFGVSELAREVGMSRSNLLRKIKKLRKISVSQFIREVRLMNAMEMLKESSLTVSEITFKVGFSSTSYFIKCFHDYYGYPPGEVGKGESHQNVLPNNNSTNDQNVLEKFWKELKRRKVVKVIIVYATISYILLQLLSILIKPLYLPQWMMTLVIVLLAIGFPIAIIFSWIFDITPAGIKVTKSLNEKGLQKQRISPQLKGVLYTLLVGVLITVIVFIVNPEIFKSDNQGKIIPDLEKSIAVLPFHNDSNDSTNVYLINGLMESILTKLQNIEELRVISRTSVEKYRNNPKQIAEIAKELNVNYLIEGSGQKIGDKILLNIQLIEARSDRHLLSEQYNRKVTDIFELQMDIAKNIAEKIQAIITPEEEERINKVPTDNIIAYDYFLKGLDLFYKGDKEGLLEAISYFEKAIEQDPKFSRAYADISIAYYYLDLFLVEKKYGNEIESFAEKAISLDSKSPQSLIAKALYFIYNNEHETAISYLENALKYNPNSSFVINYLSDFYANYNPNTEKYLEYAIKGIKLDIAAHDAISASFVYLHISNAFIQSGFIDQAEKNINKSLEYYPENLYSQYVKSYILFAKNRDLTETKNQLIEVFKKDSTRLDVMNEVGKIFYYMRDYENSYKYYKKFIDLKEAQNLNLFTSENAKIGVVLAQMGFEEESKKYFEKYREYAENDKSIYKNLSMGVYYSYKGNTEKALEHLKLFSQQDNYFIWTILFLEIDPLTDNIKNNLSLFS